jgi:aspartate/tyrosine/aromatic aminotransferase
VAASAYVQGLSINIWEYAPDHGARVAAIIINNAALWAEW